MLPRPSRIATNPHPCRTRPSAQGRQNLPETTRNTRRTMVTGNPFPVDNHHRDTARILAINTSHEPPRKASATAVGLVLFPPQRAVTRKAATKRFSSYRHAGANRDQSRLTQGKIATEGPTSPQAGQRYRYGGPGRGGNGAQSETTCPPFGSTFAASRITMPFPLTRGDIPSRTAGIASRLQIIKALQSSCRDIHRPAERGLHGWRRLHRFAPSWPSPPLTPPITSASTKRIDRYSGPDVANCRRPRRPG